MKMATKSEHSESDAEDKHSSGLNFVEDLDDEFIFESHRPIHEPATIDHIASPTLEVRNKINKKNREENIPDSTWNLNPSGKFSVDGSLSDLNSVRSLDSQNERSGLVGITEPFPEDNNLEIKPKQKAKQWNKFQTQAGLIDYLLQFIQKTALPAIQKYERLWMKYCKEKKEWTETVRFLERQNSELKCELQTADGSSGYSEIGSNNFMTFSSQNQPSVKGNSLYVPALNGIRKFVDFNFEAQPKLDVKPCVSLEPDSGKGRICRLWTGVLQV